MRTDRKDSAQIVRRQLATPMLFADSFTMCQTAFTVMPSLHALPALLTLRNSLPRSIAAAASQSSSSVLTQTGTGTVRMWPALPTRSTMAQCSSRCWSARIVLHMADCFDAFETVLECLKRMEANLTRMKQMRNYVGNRLGEEMLEFLIEEAETQIPETKRKVIQ